MRRISFVAISKWTEELRKFIVADDASNIELGITRMLAHAPKAAIDPLRFGTTLATNRTLPERLIELMRLRIAFHNQCRSCMAIRYQSAAVDMIEDELCSFGATRERRPAKRCGTTSSRIRKSFRLRSFCYR